MIAQPFGLVYRAITLGIGRRATTLAPADGPVVDLTGSALTMFGYARDDGLTPEDRNAPTLRPRHATHVPSLDATPR